MTFPICFSQSQHIVYCSRTHKFHFSATFSLKMGLTILFTHLKIISLQCFSVFSFSFQFSAVSKRTLSIFSDLKFSFIYFSFAFLGTKWGLKNPKFKTQFPSFSHIFPATKQGYRTKEKEFRRKNLNWGIHPEKVIQLTVYEINFGANIYCKTEK